MNEADRVIEISSFMYDWIRKNKFPEGKEAIMKFAQSYADEQLKKKMPEIIRQYHNHLFMIQLKEDESKEIVEFLKEKP